LRELGITNPVTVEQLSPTIKQMKVYITIDPNDDLSQRLSHMIHFYQHEKSHIINDFMIEKINTQ
jgi:cytochrome oxidase Cu insertion factor (SCO1/SenC/PrrC family)